MNWGFAEATLTRKHYVDAHSARIGPPTHSGKRTLQSLCIVIADPGRLHAAEVR
jgi:hypothetical protein